MKDIQTEYRKAVDARQVPDHLVLRTKLQMRQATKFRKIHWGILVPVCAIVVLGTLSAAAYGISYFKQSNYQSHINSSLPAAVAKSAGTQVKKTVISGSLSVGIRQMVCDNQNLYLALDVQSTNGKPLQESSEFRKSELMRQGFAESTLTVNGKDYACNLWRTDDASIPDKATFELMATGDFAGMDGTEATLTLKDFTDEVDTCEDAGFLFQNLGQLYKKMTPETPEQFIKTGLFEVYEDKSLIASSWTIPEGKQKIEFSSQFPGAYIDNIGFHKTGEYQAQNNVLYISIVPGSQSQVALLKQLCFQNIHTMQPIVFDDSIITGNGVEHVGYSSQQEFEKAVEREKNRKLEYNGGRVVIALSTFLDGGARSSDASVADLNSYRIVKNYKTEKITRNSGTWSIPFTLDFQDTARSFTPNQAMKTAGGYEITIQKISLSDLSLSFSGRCKNPDFTKDQFNSDLTVNHIKLICKDGSVINAGQKFAGEIAADGTFEYGGNLQFLLDADEVAAIEIFGNKIPLN